MRTHYHYNQRPLEEVNKRWSGLMLGSLVIGGALGAGGAALTAKKKQKAQTVLGPMQTTEGQNYNKELLDLIAKRGYGYSPESINAQTAPYAKSIRQGIQNYTMPAIGAASSARGLGRSTIPVSMGRLASQEGEYNIGERVAERVSESEKLKALQYQDALTKYGAFGKDTLQSTNLGYQSAYNTEIANQGIENENKKAMVQGIGQGAASGVMGAGGGGGFAGMLGGFGNSLSGGAGGSSGQGDTKLLSDIQDIFNKRGATVKIQGDNTSPAQRSYINSFFSK